MAVTRRMIAGLYGLPVRKYRDALGLDNSDQVFKTDVMFRLKGYIDLFGDALRVAKVAFVRSKLLLVQNKTGNGGGALRTDSKTVFGTAVNTVGQAMDCF